MNRKNLSQDLLNEFTRVAYYYYKVGLTQQEISKKLGMSRQRVNRILADCIELGIVKITIEDLNESNLEIEAELEKKYQLKAVRIVRNVVAEKIHQDLGVAAGKYLKSIINKGDIIGFSRGRSTSALVDNMPYVSNAENLTITQLLGSENQHRHVTEVDDIVYRFCQKLNAKPNILYAPVIVQDAKLRSIMMKEPYFTKAYEVIKACNIAVVGIGTANSQKNHMTSLYNSGEYNMEDVEWSKHVEGEVCSHYFDKEGRTVIPPFRNRIIAIDLEDYFKIPIRIGLAGLPEKVEAIRAALKGGYINILVTDLGVAKTLLK